MRSEQINELVTALAKAQGEMEPAVFDSTNPHFKSKYASLAAIREACKPLSKHGLSYAHILDLGDVDHPPTVSAFLFHSSGQWLCSRAALPTGAKPQEFASALTYAKRQTLSALTGVVGDDDDDANEAQAGHKQQTQAQVLFEQLKAEILAINSVVELGQWGADQGKRSYDLPQDLQRHFRAFFNGRKAAIEANATDAERAKSERIE